MILRAEKVKKDFLRLRGESNIFPAVSETDLELRPGTLTVLSGRSGSGKTTLLNMMAGLLSPTAGCVLADDLDLYALSDGERSLLRNVRFGIIPQGQSAIGSLTVLENVLLPMTLRGEEGDAARAEDLLSQLDIADLKGVYPRELSGGEQRRMAIARALVHRPEVIFADEPTGDLDDANTQEVLSLLRGAADAGAAVLLVTHEAAAENFADCKKVLARSE